MTTGVRLLSVLLVVALAGPGPLAPAAASAQSETQPPSEPPAAPTQMPPPSGPPMPGQAELYHQALRMGPPAAEDYPAAYTAGATIASMFSVPGRAVLCAAGSVLSVVTLLATFGSGYGAAKSVFEEGCIGGWIVTPDDLREANRHPGLSATYTQ